MDVKRLSSLVPQMLHRLNPWWRGAQVPSRYDKEHERPGFESLFAHAKGDRERAALLLGLRRVGKTTALHQVVKRLNKGPSSREFLYVDFGVPALKPMSIPEILDVHARIRTHRDNVVVLLDELHLSPDWDGWLRTEADRRPGYRFLATGSAAGILREKGAESGVGRWDEIYIPPLLLSEFMTLRNELAPDIPTFDPCSPPDPADYWRAYQPMRQDIAETRMDYVVHGGFPEWSRVLTRDEDRDLAQQSLREDVMEKVLGKDLSSVFSIARPDHLERLFLYLCLSSGGHFNESKAATALGISRTWIGRFVDYLHRGFLITRCKPLGLAAGPALRAKSKLYVADASLRNAVLFRGRAEIAADPDDAGRIVETTVGTTLTAFAQSRGLKLGYFRNSRNPDLVDFMVGTQAVPAVGVEVKFQGSIGRSDFAGLVSFKKKYPDAQAILLVDGMRNDLPDSVPPGICVLPVDGFLWSVGQWIFDRKGKCGA